MLEQLRCISLKNVEAKTEPYIWPALIQVDDHTLTTPIWSGSSRRCWAMRVLVIKDSMRAGDVAAIPTPVGVLRARFEDGLATRAVIVVVALLEMDETPESAMKWRGYQAYRNELRAAVAKTCLRSAARTKRSASASRGSSRSGSRRKSRSAVEDGLKLVREGAGPRRNTRLGRSDGERYPIVPGGRPRLDADQPRVRTNRPDPDHRRGGVESLRGSSDGCSCARSPSIAARRRSTP